VVEGEENDGKNCVGGVARGMRRGLGFGCLGHVGGAFHKMSRGSCKAV